VDVTAGSSAADTATAEIALLADDAVGGVGVAASWAGIGGPAPEVPFVLELAGWPPVWARPSFTDENGMLSFGQVPPGPVVVRPEPASVGGGLSVAVVAGTMTPAPFAIQPFAILSGQVVAGDAFTPVAFAVVDAIDVASGGVLATTRTDASGAYRLDGVRPGAGGVRVRAASPHDSTVTAESEALLPPVPGSTGVSALVLPVGVISGQVYRSLGSVRHPVALARDSAGRNLLAEWTNEFGGFRIVGVASGPVTVTVVDPQTGERDSQELVLDPATPESLWFFLGPEGE
jgi:hypothetical protein